METIIQILAKELSQKPEHIENVITLLDEGNTHLSLAIRMEDWSSLGQHKRKSEFPVVTRESHRNS